MNKNIVLVGLSGSGKTTVGNLLKKIFPDFVFTDTDELIVKRENCSVNEIFAQKGEKYFRELETQIVKEISPLSNQIISTGGGIVLKEENISDLQKNGIIFYLKVSPDILVKRLQGDTTRPLLKTDNVKEKLLSMLEIRGKLYEKADVIIETDKQTQDITAQEIARIYNERSNG